MIEITQDVTPESLTDKNPRAAWRAHCVIDDRPYALRSRRGAVHALARVLAEVGIPDQPVRLITMSPFVPGRIIDERVHPSLHAMAEETP